MRALLIAIGFGLMALAPAYAQDSVPQLPAETPVLPPGPPEQVQEAEEFGVDQQLERARAMLAEADADEFFTIVQIEDLIYLRHDRSNLLCMVDERTSRIMIVPSQSLGIPRGDDVACAINMGADLLTFYSTKYRRQQRLDRALTEAVAAIRARYPDARPIRAADLRGLPQLGGRNFPEYRSAAFAIDDDGYTFTRVSVAEVGDWEIKMRFSATNAENNPIADIFWLGSLLRIQTPETATVVE